MGTCFVSLTGWRKLPNDSRVSLFAFVSLYCVSANNVRLCRSEKGEVQKPKMRSMEISTAVSGVNQRKFPRFEVPFLFSALFASLSQVITPP